MLSFTLFRAGAVGINLTQANRIYLMEPSFNTALEDQAVGRVHRLGQTRPTLITRLVMKDSIEERLLKSVRKRPSNGSVPVKDDKGKATMAGASALIGNVATDRASILAEDFDLLYGVQRSTPDSALSYGQI